MPKSRDKVILKNSILNYSIQFVLYGISFLSVPLLLNYLGQEKFGVFQTILTFISWAYLANLGIGNGLRNKVSEFFADNRIAELKNVIGSGFYISFIISLSLLLVGNFVIYFFFNPEFFFKNLSIPVDEVRTTFIISYSFFCINLFLGIFSSITFGIHKSYLATLVQLVQLGLFCLVLYIAILLQLASFLPLVAATYGIAMVIAQLVPFFSIARNKKIWPPTFSERKKYNKVLLNLSLSFFVLELCTVVLFSSDNFIISKLLGAKDVAVYSIINKIFFLVITLFSILLVQVWNSTTDALAKKDYIWIRKTITRLHLLLIGILFGATLIAVFFNQFTELWLGVSYDIPLSFRLLFVLYVLIHCSNAIYTVVLNGIARLKVQTYIYLIAAFLNYFLSYYFIVYLHTGMAGVLYSKIICIFLTLLACRWDYFRFIKGTKPIVVTE